MSVWRSERHVRGQHKHWNRLVRGSIFKQCLNAKIEGQKSVRIMQIALSQVCWLHKQSVETTPSQAEPPCNTGLKNTSMRIQIIHLTLSSTLVRYSSKQSLISNFGYRFISQTKEISACLVAQIQCLGVSGRCLSLHRNLAKLKKSGWWFWWEK